MVLGDEDGPLLGTGGSGRRVDLGEGGGGEDEGESEGRKKGAKKGVVHQAIVGGDRGESERKGAIKGRLEVGRPFEVEE